ncbi:hypothetical protein OG21DRAFT_1502293 [Imleria badia]|nr:hypothetical protein OG21DRAFT_1502293 [Imleria badia]
MSLAPPNHNPLLVEDIFYVILGFLSEPNRGYSKPDIVEIRTPPKEGRRALVALARTCHILSEPSLNCLWRKLDSLGPLLRCFKKDLRRPLSLAEWCINNRYSHRVQELEVSDDESLVLLKRAASKPNFLPNLRVLIWDIMDGRLTFIRPLLGSQLVSFKFCLVFNPGNCKELKSFLKTLPSHCPALKSVSFDFDLLDEHVAESISPVLSRAVCSLEKLAHLDIHAPIDAVALRHLVMSPQFTDLVITIWRSQLEDISLLPSDMPFSGMKDITLCGLDLGSITGGLRSESQMFSSIEFRLAVPPTSQLTLSFLTLLASPPRRSSLQSITLTQKNVTTFSPGHSKLELEDIHYSLSRDILQPLVFFHNLHELVIHLKNPISLNNEELVDLARGWPLLRFLRLVSTSGLSAKYVTLQGLLLLAVACPKLDFLELCLDARDVPTTGAGMDVRSASVKVLRCPWSPINDPRLVGMFLSKHFPSVDWVMGQGMYGNQWRRACDYLQREDTADVA